MNVLAKAWEAWKRFARGFARVQTLVLITVLYFIVIAPLGTVLRVFGWDPLEARRKRRARETNWKPVADSEPSPDSLRHQS